MSNTTDHAADSSSPPRKRRWWRWPLRVFLVGFIAFACWLGSWVYWAYTVEPNPTVDYAAKLEQLSRDAQPEGENAWPLIEEAIAIFERMEDAFPRNDRPPFHERGIILSVIQDPPDLDDIQFDDPNATSIDPTIEFAEQALQWLRENEVFESVIAATGRPTVVPVENKGLTLFLRELPALARSRGIAKAAVASMQLAVENGEWDRVPESIDVCMTLAAVWTHQGTMIEHLVGLAIFALIRQEIINLVLTADLDVEQLRAIGASVERHSSAIGNASIAIEGERYQILDVAQNVFSDDGKGDGYFIATGWEYLTPAAAEMSRMRNVQAIYGPRRAETEAAINRLTEGYIEASHLPRAQRLVRMAEVEAYRAGQPSRLRPITGFLQAESTSKFLEQSERTLHQVASLRLLLAIESHRAVHGAPPENLKQLAPEFIPAIPIDPLSEREFGYRLGEYRVARHGYVLYSFGRDGVDNGGEYHSMNPYLGFEFDMGVDILLNALPDELEIPKSD